MSVYVAEIAGRAIVAFSADSDATARERLLGDEALQSDLIVLESGGRSLWDGQAEILVRQAFPDEAERFEDSMAVAAKEGVTRWVFLVPVTDPTVFDDDDDDDDDDRGD